MGGRQSKRSVDITTTPKKEGENALAEGEGKLEKIGDIDVKVTSNGAIHTTDIEFADKDETPAKEEAEEVKENGVSDSEEAKAPGGGDPKAVESPEAVAMPEDKQPEVNSEKVAEETPEPKKTKEKTKKKKWSFRSISFSKKDKTKPNKDADKNGDVKEVAEEGTEEKPTSPAEETPKAETEAKPESEEPKKAEEAPAAEEKKPEPASTEVKPEEEPKPEPKPEEKPEEKAQPPVEEPPKPVEKPEETKEVRNEEIPPPLPSSNPPSSVTVFAESTKADALPPDQLPQTSSESIPEAAVVVLTPEKTDDKVDQSIAVENETKSEKIEPESKPEEKVESKPEEKVESKPEEKVESKPEEIVESKPEEPKEEVAPEAEADRVKREATPPPAPKEQENKPESPVVIEAAVLLVDVDAVVITTEELPPPPASPTDLSEATTESAKAAPASEPAPPSNAESLQDLSTTESLPSLPEPLSEGLPEPMSLPPIDIAPEPIADESVPPQPPISETPNLPSQIENGEVLTNGNSNGFGEEIKPPSVDGPLKQVPSTENPNEVRQGDGDKAVTDAEAPAAKAAAEE